MNLDFAIDWKTCGLSLVFGYLLGSIPFGLIFTWLAGAGDVRKIGSGNIGATNVLRTGKRWAAALTLVFDAGKGAAAVLIAQALYGDVAAAFAGLGAFLGHLFPVWLRFKGGKGVATFLGVTTRTCLACRTACGRNLAGGRRDLENIVALGADRCRAGAALRTLSTAGPANALLVSLLALMIFVMHRENIARLARGEEPRIGGAKPSAP